MSVFSQDASFRVLATTLHQKFIKSKEDDSLILEDEKSKLHFQVTVELLKYGRILV